MTEGSVSREACASDMDIAAVGGATIACDWRTLTCAELAPERTRAVHPSAAWGLHMQESRIAWP